MVHAHLQTNNDERTRVSAKLLFHTALTLDRADRLKILRPPRPPLASPLIG